MLEYRTIFDITGEYQTQSNICLAIFISYSEEYPTIINKFHHFALLHIVEYLTIFGNINLFCKILSKIIKLAFEPDYLQQYYKYFFQVSISKHFAQ